MLDKIRKISPIISGVLILIIALIIILIILNDIYISFILGRGVYGLYYSFLLVHVFLSSIPIILCFVVSVGLFLKKKWAFPLGIVTPIFLIFLFPLLWSTPHLEFFSVYTFNSHDVFRMLIGCEVICFICLVFILLSKKMIWKRLKEGWGLMLIIIPFLPILTIYGYFFSILFQDTYIRPKPEIKKSDYQKAYQIYRPLNQMSERTDHGYEPIIKITMYPRTVTPPEMAIPEEITKKYFYQYVLVNKGLAESQQMLVKHNLQGGIENTITVGDEKYYDLDEVAVDEEENIYLAVTEKYYPNFDVMILNGGEGERKPTEIRKYNREVKLVEKFIPSCKEGWNLQISKQGNIFVSPYTDKDEVFIYDKEGKLLRVIRREREKGWAPIRFEKGRPAFKIDAQENIYFAYSTDDESSNSVKVTKLSNRGEFISEFYLIPERKALKKEVPSRFLRIDNLGNLYISYGDFYSVDEIVREFSPQGELIWESPLFRENSQDKEIITEVSERPASNEEIENFYQIVVSREGKVYFERYVPIREHGIERPHFFIYRIK